MALPSLILLLSQLPSELFYQRKKFKRENFRKLYVTNHELLSIALGSLARRFFYPGCPSLHLAVSASPVILTKATSP
jgi:hypothetical protein